MERHSRSPSLSSGLESAYSPRRSSGASSHYSVSRTPSPAPSADNDDGDDDTPAQKLTRAEIGGYAALLSGLRARDGSGLAARLLSGVPRWALRSPTPEEEDELASSSAPGSPATPTTARTRRGSAAPSLVFSEPPVPEEQADAATRWPLHPAELEPGPPLAAALADAAARVVHRDALALPRPALGAINLRRKRRREEEEGSEEEEALAPEVADVVAARVSMVLDRTLASLAAMQGVSLARDRKVMAWPAVLAAAGMVADQR
ncbi:hypothetical protein Q8F55_007122 [Vanrija albida]|uniref:REJ domain-containing protein n=1 Tax=Vanrija albida TaxID=181172 RepID=A0ABR3PZ00_9TREE